MSRKKIKLEKIADCLTRLKDSITLAMEYGVNYVFKDPDVVHELEEYTRLIRTVEKKYPPTKLERFKQSYKELLHQVSRPFFANLRLKSPQSSKEQ